MNICRVFLFVWLTLAAANAQAEDDTAIINVTVTVNAEPCVINNNQVIDIDFGNDVITTDVAAGLAQRFIYYSLDCEDADPNKQLVMRISGAGASFNSDYLQTSIPDLGIKISTDGDALFRMNSDMLIDATHEPPTLKATLVKAPNTRLPTGEFSAGATMTVGYQ